MLRDLLLNFCLLITLTYLLSLTYRVWPEPKSPRLQTLRLGFEALMPLALLMSPAQIAPGVLADLRVVPIALTALRLGPQFGILVAIPVLLYRVYLGGPGVVSTFVSVIGVVGLAALLRPRLPIDNPQFSWRASWPWIILLFLPNTFLLPIVTRNPLYYLDVYLPVLILDVVGFMIAQAMLLSRLRLLQLTSTLRTQANQDKLTGLLNRRQFDADLPALQPQDALLLIDVDHFKRVNDQYGHQVGDLVLARVGQSLAAGLRATDRAYRYGGEEFAVMVKGNERSEPAAIAERIRQQLAAISFPELAQGHITVSVGVAQASHDQVLKHADAALYQAKQTGRNRVEVWQTHRVGEAAR